MEKPKKPKNELSRLEFLHSLEILDTDPTQAYDDITKIASQICDTPIALVSLIDKDRQWFKSRFGLEAEETPREFAFCGHAINEPNQLFEISDSTKDERFYDNPLVTGDPKVRFYAGVPITIEEHTIGTLCVIDHSPRKLDQAQRDALWALSRQVKAQIELAQKEKETNKLNEEYLTIIENIKGVIFRTDGEGKFNFINQTMVDISEFSRKELLGMHYLEIIHPEDRARIEEYYRNNLKEKQATSEEEFRILTKSGKTKWVSQHTRLNYNSNLLLKNILGSVRDITASKEHQKHIEESNLLLSSILETMGSGIIVLDHKGNYLLHNSTVENLLAISTETIPIEECAKYYGFYQLDQETLLKAEELPSQKALNGQNVDQQQVFIKNDQHPEGIYASFTARPMRNKQNQITGAVVVIANITDQKEKEYEVSKGLNLLNQTQLMAGIGHWEVDFKKEKIFWSEQTKKIHEVDLDYKPTLDKGINFFDKESQPVVKEVIENALTKHQGWDIKLKIISAKGKLKWVRSIGKPHLEGKEVTKIFGVFQDITPDKLFEEKLKESEKKVRELNQNLEEKVRLRTIELFKSRASYRKLYNEAPDMMCTINPTKETVVECNRTTLNTLGLKKENIIGETVFNLCHKNSHKALRNAIISLTKNGKIENTRLNLITDSNDVIPVILKASALYNKSNSTTQIHATMRDISELVEAEEALKKLNQDLEIRVEQRTKQLQQLNQEMEEFTYITTHDLKSPVSNIKGFFSIIKNELQDHNNGTIENSLKWIDRSIHQAEEKIKAVVEVARLQESFLIQKEKIKLNHIFSDVLEELNPNIEKNNARLSINIPDELSIKANKQAFRIVVFNLIHNALKYRHPDRPPIITVSVEKNPKNFIIFIEDNGLGMDIGKNPKKVFGMFKRMHDHVEGTGIGLYMVQKIIENMNGNISVESIVNQGSTFRIQLPKK